MAAQIAGIVLVVVVWTFVLWVILARERHINRLKAENADLQRWVDIERDRGAIKRGLGAIAGKDLIRGWMDQYQEAIDDPEPPPKNRKERHKFVKDHFLGIYQDSVKFWTLDKIAGDKDYKIHVLVEDTNGERMTIAVNSEDTIPDRFKVIEYRPNTENDNAKKG